jgi:Secretion system C-terminal sorting domain
MKKIVLFLSGIIFSINAMAQISVSADTAYYTGARGGADVAIPITVSNAKNLDVTVNWNVDLANSIIPTGFTPTGVCFLPSGGCFPFSGASHPNLILAGTTQAFDLNINIGPNARLDSNCIIVLNTDLAGHNKLVFNIKAVQWATALQNKPSRVKLDMYPQPAVNTLNIVHNDTRVAKAVVYSLLGRRVQEYNTPIGADGFSIPTSELVDGVYFIDIRDAAGNNLATQKFTKQ